MTQHFDRAGTLPAIESDLFYLALMGERPRSYVDEPPPGEVQSNAATEARRVAIRDMRPVADRLSLDREGFRLIDAPSQVTDFYDEGQVVGRYYTEVERLLRAATGASRIHIFDHTIRRRVPGADDRTAGQPRQPVPRVHVDHTDRSGPQIVRDRLGAEADELLRGRVQILNVWRPIRGPVRDAPLAACDARSVAPADLVPTDLIYPHRVGETYSVRYSQKHRWFYAPGMRTDEVLLLKCYDSARDGRARFAPHTAFEDPDTPDDAPPRESIEVRALVFHPPADHAAHDRT